MRIRLFHTEGFRIAAIFVALFALSAAVMAISVLVIVRREFQNQIIQFANADIAAVQDGYNTEGDKEAREIIKQRMAGPGASDFFLLQRDDKRLAGNMAPMTPRVGVLSLPGPGARSSHKNILGVAAFLAPGLYVFAGSDIRQTRRVQDDILGILVWTFAAALLLAIGAAVFVSRSFLSRTEEISRACRAIMDGDLKTRVPIRGAKDELDQLSENINTMLDRIAALMESVRQVTNDIAHDLRTPVTHLHHRLENARLKATTPGDYDKALESAIAASDDILALFAALLRIAQIEGGVRRAGFAPLDLAELLGQLREMLAPVADDAGHKLHLSTPPSACVRGDRELIVQMLTNLIENAIMHTPAGTNVTLSLATLQGNVLVSVSDDGPGVPPDEHEKLFRRLYRGEASRTQPGYGLGLALVSAIAELHGGKVTTRRDGTKGFCVSVSFPLLGDPPP